MKISKLRHAELVSVLIVDPESIPIAIEKSSLFARNNLWKKPLIRFDIGVISGSGRNLCEMEFSGLYPPSE
ncbi:hypothetical protein [Gramella sp. KN1008]|uniref:hypothetical protein n=1 Tax=Gramella sp. KN1008 TaxID=2529298 RepID=UPI001039F81B|nr:hypothetical protein [Gramella sp. KN1008]TBW30047.1 hypothetical protein EZJ28_01195 [Gramella sp. KN1008]